MSTIAIDNTNAIKHLEVVVDEPGIHILRGMNDSGKSLGLESIQRALGGPQKLTRRHGSASAGTVTVPGVKLTVGGTTRKSGELEIESIESKLSLDDIIAPLIKNPVAADKVRTKAILTLTEASPDLSLFYELVGGRDELLALAPEEDLRGDDLVDVALNVKQAIEAGSRKAASSAKTAADKAASLTTSADGIDVEAEHNAEKLQAASNEAVRVQARVCEQVKAREDAREAAEQAKQRYEEEVEYDLDAATKAVETAKAELEAAEEREAHALQVYNDAKMASEANRTAVVITEGHYDTAVAYEQAQEERKAMIEAFTKMPNPTTEDEDEVGKSVIDTHHAVIGGSLIRAAIRQLAEAKELTAEAATLQGVSDSLRESAKSVDAILAEAIDAPGIRVVDGRLVTDKDGVEVFFADRSFGTRCRIAVDAILSHVGGSGRMVILCLSQRQWEGLDHANRNALHEACVEKGVRLITAEADKEPHEGDTGEVRAEAFEPTSPPAKKTDELQ